ncbi:GNAT family N-acetyltransferase [Psychrosphaera sp. F3M07]|jgi:ribosomal protein S18 acetylase RimI-like enzyme|uniref:GNAT family N-acetyltransferase n=1 Tax=Psychrosphaera aquimarina TaxID=2044854 RepID=A0ABU3QVG4_9GAMM|nr:MULTISPECIES: GNAT family N-acetyltransferase [Psychrosphaera]MBU2918457.1 GNAT family N-acetyltransferase [Psychrosphaera sp. F3M07]MDU0111452.1 GNAT family N-acetyltransferase [Psychrosphaera aquimarina]
MDVTQNMTEIDGIKAVLLSAEDINLAASLLFVSYHDDPVFLDIFQHSKPDYDQRLRGAIREELATFWNTQQPMIGLFSGKHLLGVACLIEPQTGLEPERFWHWRLKMMLNAGYLSTQSMIEKEKRVAAAIPHEHYHLLTFIAIHPDHQQHGLGHYLIKAVDTIVDENPITEGVAVFVTKEKNQALFNDDNYKKLDTIKVGEVTGTLMFRDK